MNFGAYWFSDKLVLAHVPRAAGRRGRRRRSSTASCATWSAEHQMPMPKLYIIPTEAPNAFATGRNPQHAAVAVTEGILRLLRREELEGVLAHELAHVRNRDTLISTIAATLAGVIMMLANMLRWAAIFGGVQRDERDGGGGIFGLLAMTILAPLAATLIQLAISRSREFEADATGARAGAQPPRRWRRRSRSSSTANEQRADAAPARRRPTCSSSTR